MDVTKKKTKKHLLVVDDNEVLCHFLQKCLTQVGYVVDTSLKGEQIPWFMERHTIHLVVLDVVLPGKDGMYWLKWLRQYYPAIPVVMMSVKTGPEERVQGLESGAQDYLSKPFHDRELLIKVQRLLDKKVAEFRENILQVGEMTVNIAGKYLCKQGNQIALTGLECKLLQLFYMNAGVPLSREELTQQTMGISYIPQNRTIDTHITRLRKKIEDIPSRPVHIRTVRGKGYCFHLSGEL